MKKTWNTPVVAELKTEMTQIVSKTGPYYDGFSSTTATPTVAGS